MSAQSLPQATSPTRRLPKINPVYVLVVALILAIIVMNPAFGEPTGYMNFLKRVTALAILSAGALYVIVSGGFDLSVGSIMTLTVIGSSMLASNDPNSTYWIIPLMLGIGAVIGLINGLVVSYLKVPSLIATLGMMLILKGLSLVISGTRPIYFNGTPGFTQISQGSLIGSVIPSLPIPNGVLILFLVAIATSFILERTILGRFTFALGSNEEAVRLSGVNTDRWKIAVYALAGSICGIAGLLIASRLNSAQPALGQGYELDAIAAVVIGGTSLSGGRGTIIGTLIGALIISVLANGLRILSVAQEWQTVVTGSIIILAVYTDILRRRRL